MWSLADDLEHVLAHRDPHDWYVFEAASWALAARRMPARAPPRTVAGAAAGGGARRSAAPRAAVRLHVRRRAVPPRRPRPPGALRAGTRALRSAASRPSRSSSCSTAASRRSARAKSAPTSPRRRALGFEEVLEGSPASKTIRALDTVITLSLTTDEFLALLSENVEIAEGIFRLLIDRRGAPGWHAVMHGEISPSLRRKVDSGLQAVDRVLLLQSSPLLQRATATQLVSLAAVARPVTLKTGEDPTTGAEPSILIVLSGVVGVEREGARARERRGRRRHRHLRNARQRPLPRQGPGDDRRPGAPLRAVGHLRPAGRRHRPAPGHLQRPAEGAEGGAGSVTTQFPVASCQFKARGRRLTVTTSF